MLTIMSLMLLAGAPPAPIELQLPVACDPSAECSIQKYMDHDPGPGRHDYTCGRLSLDGDTGTDFRVANYPAMEAGVEVLAAAGGFVKATRDGMPDISVLTIGQKAIKGREAGNGVVIDHGNGWETQYSHLMRGSVSVRQGDQVKAGDTLGMIGLSGNTEFPHMEFSVRYHGKRVDPFVGISSGFKCGDPTTPLWSDDALQNMPYRPVVFLSGGFTDAAADIETARLGGYDSFEVKAGSPALVFWADISGIAKGDVETVTIMAPDGSIFTRQRKVHEANNISWFMFTGKKRPAKGWQRGEYKATYVLNRARETLAVEEKSIEFLK